MNQIIPHLFRTEYRKIIAVLCRRFGFTHVEVAEDIASETFLTASQSWGLNGIPANPVGWLHEVAKNKAVNYLRRQQLFQKKIVPAIKSDVAWVQEEDIDLSPKNIDDSQLQMMFAVCNPVVATEAQVALALRILCGFSVDEIAKAFFSNKETISKRIFRAKEKLYESNVKIELPPLATLENRLSSVLTTIYLMFNEGYYSTGENNLLRKEVCFEAMRLCTMLIENEYTNKPEANALLSLMCFHASRFDARFNEEGELVLYAEQDNSLWNIDYISKGAYFLRAAATGNLVSRFHLEAGIAYWHTQQADSKVKWENVLQLYNQLLQIAWSPSAALNRIWALSKLHGKQAAIADAEKLGFVTNVFYHSLLGELYTSIDDDKAIDHFRKAIPLASSEKAKASIEKKLNSLISS